MKNHRFELRLAAAFLVLWSAVWAWQHPGALGARIGARDVERYMRALERLPYPAEERPQLLARARAWMESDDGKPVYMLNLMRFHPELRRFEGAPADYDGTPVESNARYESVVMPMLFAHGGYPLYAGVARPENLMEYRPELDRWSRLLVVRYPSRRAFLDLIAEPGFQAVEPYKLMALSVVLTPTEADVVIPELDTLFGAGLLCVFLATGWWRSSRRSQGKT